MIHGQILSYKEFLEEIKAEICLAKVVGLGSGGTIAQVLKHLAKLKIPLAVKFVPTSLQIRAVADAVHLNLVEMGSSPEIDFYIDSADKVSLKPFFLVKGGGGALFNEKVLMYTSKKCALVVQREKMISGPGFLIPVEVAPRARVYVAKNLLFMKGRPKLRTLRKGYPYYTENGNVILDTLFDRVSSPRELETTVKGIPGVVEVGIFSRKPNLLYKLNPDGTVERMLQSALQALDSEMGALTV